MPGNARHAITVAAQRGMLALRYEHDPNILVGMDMQLEAREGKRRDVVVPDVLVVFGVPDKKRDSYKAWEEGKVPDFVLEVASKGTFKNDLGRKKNTYERMGVREYCVFDPKGGMHRPRLQLFRLEGGVYRPVSGRGDPDGPLSVPSESLGLELRFEDDRMRLWDPETREFLLEHREERAGRLEERAGRLKERSGRLKERSGRLEERAGRLKERAGRLKERSGRLKERSGRLKERAGRLEERAGRLEEHDKRIVSEQRARELEAELAHLKEWLRRKP